MSQLSLENTPPFIYLVFINKSCCKIAFVLKSWKLCINYLELLQIIRINKLFSSKKYQEITKKKKSEIHLPICVGGGSWTDLNSFDCEKSIWEFYVSLMHLDLMRCATPIHHSI